MSYTLLNSPQYQLPKPVAPSKCDDSECFYMDELNNAKRNCTWKRTQQNRPELHRMFQNGDFIAAVFTQVECAGIDTKA